MQNLTRAVATVGSHHSSSWPGSGFCGQWGAAGAHVPADGDIDSRMMELTLVRPSLFTHVHGGRTSAPCLFMLFSEFSRHGYAMRSGRTAAESCLEYRNQDGGPLNPVFGGGWGNPNPGFDLAADENGVHMAPQPPTSRLMGQFLLPPGSGAICRMLRIQCMGMRWCRI